MVQGNLFEQSVKTGADEKLISFYISTSLLDRLDTFKTKGVCKSRTETLTMVITAGLRGLEPHLQEMEQAAKVLEDLKKDIL